MLVNISQGNIDNVKTSLKKEVNKIGVVLLLVVMISNDLQ